jgi:hypothetical protein
MTDAEQTEYLGLAAALGRVMMSLKQTEALLAETQAELAKLKEELDRAT